jgi:hypothetical protein
MANNIQSTGRVFYNIGAGQRVGDANFTIYTTSSACSAEDRIIGTGSWAPLLTSSLAGDVRMMFFDNQTTSSSPNAICKIATDSGGSNVISILTAGDSALIPWSGSTSLYAKSFVSESFLSYQLSAH